MLFDRDLLFVVACICCLEPEKWFKIHIKDTFCIMELDMSFYAWVAQREALMRNYLNYTVGSKALLSCIHKFGFMYTSTKKIYHMRANISSVVEF